MQMNKMITTVDTHTAGEPTRIITGGIPHIPGKTMMEKKLWMQSHLDHVRRMVMLEPRGHKDMFGAVITAPACDDAHAGVIFMDSKGYLDMCGHGSIGSVTMLLNTGMVPVDLKSGCTSQEVVIDTPAGKIIAHAAIEDGVATEVRICNVPSFYYDSVTIELPSIGRINVDISYGGNFFALVNVRDLNMEIKLDNIEKLKALGLEIRSLVNEMVTVVHPGSGEKGHIPLTEIYQDGSPCRNIVVFGNGQIDRSPCGTGTCAKMAYLYEKGRLGIGEPYRHASIINTVFTGKILEESVVGNRRAILPEITGQAHITGFHSFIAERYDPFKEGFDLC